MGLHQYNSLGEYCDPHTAYSVFLILMVWGEMDIPSSNAQHYGQVRDGYNVKNIISEMKCWIRESKQRMELSLYFTM